MGSIPEWRFAQTMADTASFDGIVHQVVAILEGAGVEHALIGGIAVGLHGYPRATGDVNLLVDGARRDDIVRGMQGAGFRLLASTE